MPYFAIDTNMALKTEDTMKIMKSASSMIAQLLGKPESFVMVSIRKDVPMLFAGTTEPTAFVRLKSISLPLDRCAELSEKICAFVEEELEVPQSRIYIDFVDLERSLFGWNGKTF